MLSLPRNSHQRASLWTQWLGICLPVEGTQVRSLIGEDPMCFGATQPEHHSYGACAPETVSCNY